jgi:FMN phosphatase YigB (HAD superfamily)
MPPGSDGVNRTDARVILFDCGDTLVDEGTEVKNENGESLCAELLPGAGELLRTLKSLGYRMGLVADGPPATFRNNLGPEGLFELFDVHAISGELGYEKPAPEIFLYALECLDIPQEHYGRVVMVGNHLGRDVRGANLLGLTSVWLDWAPRRAKIPLDRWEVPDYTIERPLQLLEVLEELDGE